MFKNITSHLDVMFYASVAAVCASACVFLAASVSMADNVLPRQVCC